MVPASNAAASWEPVGSTFSVCRMYSRPSSAAMRVAYAPNPLQSHTCTSINGGSKQGRTRSEGQGASLHTAAGVLRSNAIMHRRHPHATDPLTFVHVNDTLFPEHRQANTKPQLLLGHHRRPPPGGRGRPRWRLRSWHP